MGIVAEHVSNVRTHAAAASRTLPAYRSAVAAAPPVEARTQFCTPTGWHRYDALTSAMRAVLGSADGGYGAVRVRSRRTADRLVAMGLIEWRGVSYKLTGHGSIMWIELS